ncbi:ABC transporter permease [Eggerthella timonensis]|uniref:ABC transporter permease n=1 Tax=Eggerthella timonensis TaxID=1871008 RepID=UPI000C77E74D|nr:ABC transporter permease [Eggerthella timonensis]
MAGIFTRFTLRTLARNRVRTAVTVIGIALSAALLAAVLTSVASVQAGMLERTRATEGSWHVFSSEVPGSAVDALAKSDRVSGLATFAKGGSAALSEQDARYLGPFLTLKSLPTTAKGADEPDGAPFALMPELVEGGWPRTGDEIVLPGYFKGETLGADGEGGVASDGPVEVGGIVTADLGARTTDGEEETIVDARPRTLTVTGFYEHQPSYLANNYTAASSSSVALNAADSPATVADADGEPLMGAYVVTQGFGSRDEMQAFFEETTGLENVETTLYHTNLFAYLGIADNRPIWGTLWMVAAVLAAVIVVASVSLIYNAFAISVAERTRQFGLLASLGASKRQLRRTVLTEALLLGLLGVPLGLFAGVAGTAGVFAASQEAFAAMLGAGATGLRVHVDAGALAVAAGLSFATLLVSAWVPSARAARVSAVDAIRQTQDVRLSKRAERAASSKRRAEGAPVRLGLAGRLFGVPGFVAHRNLSRAAARGRTVVASLAVSVALVVVTGSVALYLAPLSERAGSTNGAASGADIVVSAHANSSGMRDVGDLSDNAAALDEFLARASRIDGLELIGSCRQGQAEGIVEARMITDEARRARAAYDGQVSAGWVPPSFGSDGTYYGSVNVFYVDEASWNGLVADLGLDADAYDDPANPRAIGLNTYQDTMPDGTYVSTTPFAATGAIDLFAIEAREGFSIMGVQEGADGRPAVGYLDQAQDVGDGAGLTVASVDEAATVASLEIGALVSEEPDAVNAISGNNQFPSIILPESVAASAVGRGDYHENPFTYSFAGFSFTAADHEKAAAELEEIARDYADGISVNVNDVAEHARQSRLIMQAVQLFVLCFSVITTLIAVANVFNTLANGIILRTREFATLRSIGMGNRAFARMLAYECASYALRGLAIGLAAAAVATYGLYRATSLAFAGLSFALPWGHVGAAVAIVLAVLALSVAYALRRSHAASIVDSLRSDAI